MKQLLYLPLIALLISACGQSHTNQKGNGTTADIRQDAKVKVYYFHGKQRCKTCLAIERIARETVEKQFKNTREVAFIAVDFSKEENEALAEKYEIAMSSLIIASGDKSYDLTEVAFANALNNPGSLRQMIVNVTRNYLTH
jgi:thiol-disulfide isomerase/thioredoxin